MTRSLLTLCLLLLASGLVGCESGPDDGTRYVEGVHYRTVEDAAPAGDGPVTVTEFFAFECRHCADLEPALDAWLDERGDSIRFLKVPMSGNPRWEPGARAYHAADLAGVADEIVMPYFDAVHEKRRRMQSEDDLALLFRVIGVPEARFRELFRSEEVSLAVAEAEELAQRYRVVYTPTIVVDGRYVVEPRRGMRGWDEMLDVVDHLIEKSREADAG